MHLNMVSLGSVVSAQCGPSVGEQIEKCCGLGPEWPQCGETDREVHLNFVSLGNVVSAQNGLSVG